MDKGFLTKCKFGYRIFNGKHLVCSCMLPYPSGHFAEIAAFKKTCTYTDNMEDCPEFKQQSRIYGNEYGSQKRKSP